jgi:hypothetical protein
MGAIRAHGLRGLICAERTKCAAAHIKPGKLPKNTASGGMGPVILIRRKQKMVGGN